jgi:hypothetical protein
VGDFWRAEEQAGRTMLFSSSDYLAPQKSLNPNFVQLFILVSSHSADFSFCSTQSRPGHYQRSPDMMRKHQTQTYTAKYTQQTYRDTHGPTGPQSREIIRHLSIMSIIVNRVRLIFEMYKHLIQKTTNNAYHLLV